MSKDPKKAARLLRASFAGLLTLALPYQFASAGVPASGLGAGSLAASTPLVIQTRRGGGHAHVSRGLHVNRNPRVNRSVHVSKNIHVNRKNIHVNKNVYVKGKNWYVRGWRHRPYYGTVIAGVALGTIIGVTAVGVAPPPPAGNLCWYWTDPAKNRGYWDYCY
jgi:hypothetical protein